MADTVWNRAGAPRSGLDIAAGMLEEMALLIDPLTVPEAAAYVAGRYDLPPRHVAHLVDMFIDREVDKLRGSM